VFFEKYPVVLKHGHLFLCHDCPVLVVFAYLFSLVVDRTKFFEYHPKTS